MFAHPARLNKFFLFRIKPESLGTSTVPEPFLYVFTIAYSAKQDILRILI